MKHLVAFLSLAVFTTTGAYAAGSAPAAPAAPHPVDIGPQDSLLRRPTPTPEPAQSSTSPKEKKPLMVTLGKDNSGKENVTTFSSTDPKIYLVWKAETGTKGEKVHIAWYAEDTGGAVAKNKKLTEATQTIPGTGSVSGSSFIEKPASGFPAGKYRVDVSDDGKPAKSLKFTIKK